MQEGQPRILVLNPGSTSTKVALFRGEEKEAEASLPLPQMESCGLWDELAPRLREVRRWMEEEGIEVGSLTAVVGRGGLLRPLEGGTYRVTENMLKDARTNLQGTHASNLGCALAAAIADDASLAWEAGKQEEAREPKGECENGSMGVPSFVVDPVSTDEMERLARYSGLREISRRSLSHALSIHSLVRAVCRREGRGVEGSRFVVAHLGGGISICPVLDGKIIDASNANSGGPFSPSRAGGLPTQELLDLARSGSYTDVELREMTVKAGGLVSYLGTDDALAVERLIESGDEAAREVYAAMAYQVSKEIGAMATVLKGEVDKVLLTGGLASSSLLTGWVRERVASVAPVEVWPEVEEMRALAEGVHRVLSGEEEAKEY